MAREIQRFEVSLKVFIVDQGKSLLVREADTGYWELPGGRIDVGEEWDAHERVLMREIREELGEDFTVAFGREAVTWTRQRPSDGVFQFIVAKLATPVAGVPRLSAEHDDMGWFTLDEASRLTFPERSNYREGLAALWALVASR